MKGNLVLKQVGIMTVIFSCIISSSISFVYLLTNLRLLFSGDWLIYSIPTLGFFDTFFSVISYSAIIGFGAISYLHFIKPKILSIPIYSILCIGFFFVSLMYIGFNKLWPSDGIEGIIVFINKAALLFVNLGLLMTVVSE